MPVVNDIVKIMDELAPVESQLAFDNSGLLAGHANAEVKNILLALEVSDEVINEAKKRGCQLIITHHPLIFHAEKTVTDLTYQGGLLMRLIESGIALYSSHTPLDAAPGGCADTLCALLGMNGKSIPGDSCCRYAEIPPITLGALAKRCFSVLGTVSPRFGGLEHDAVIRNVMVCTGAGGDCIAMKTDCIITGELKYHEALQAAYYRTGFIECGHYETEIPVLPVLKQRLQNRFNMLQYNIGIEQAYTCTNPYLKLGGE